MSGPYKQQVLAALQAEYETICESAPVAPQIGRALLRLREESCQFIHHLGLMLRAGQPRGPLWGQGPEFLLPEINAATKQLQYVRYRLGNRFDAELNADQDMLALEMQQLIFRLVGSLRSDELMDLVGDAVAFQAVARFVFFGIARERHPQAAFWAEDHVPAWVFHYRILQTLARIQHSKYENSQATSSILIVADHLAEHFYWTHYLDMDAGFDLLTRAKFGLKLSDGRLTTLVFSNSGVFLGFYASDDAFARLGDYGQGVWLWQILPTGILLGTRNPAGAATHQPDLLFDGNSWRYLNYDLVWRKLLTLAPSLAEVNRKLWQVALRLSERKQGGLLFIVDDVDQLDAICPPAELNLAGPSRFDLLEPLSEPTRMSERRVSPKEYVLEQYRNLPLDAIDTEVLVSFARIDGALVVSARGRLLGFGVILGAPGDARSGAEAGARTAAARLASRYGLVIKISEDGPIAVYHHGGRVIEN